MDLQQYECPCTDCEDNDSCNENKKGCTRFRFWFLEAWDIATEYIREDTNGTEEAEKT